MGHAPTNGQKRSDAPKKADDKLWMFWRAKVSGIETDWKFWQAELVQSVVYTAKSTLQKSTLQLDHLFKNRHTAGWDVQYEPTKKSIPKEP